MSEPRYWYAHDGEWVGIIEEFKGAVLEGVFHEEDVRDLIIKLHNDHVVEWHVQHGTNPNLPPAPEDGKHTFGGTGYRCRRCGCYNRYANNPPFFEPCLGEWMESGKLRHAAKEKWLEDQRAFTHG